MLLAAATLAAFLMPFMGSAVNVALPTISAAFSMSALSVTWVASAFLLAAAMVLVPAGRLADLIGRKKIFLTGAVIFAAGSLACIGSPNQGVFIALRAVQGVGAAMTFGTGTAMLISAYPPEIRGKILGINIAGVYIGLTIGPFVGGMLVQHLGWESIFIFTALLGALVAALAMGIGTQPDAAASGEVFDWPGAALYAVALFSLMYGFSVLPSLAAAVWIAAGVAGLVFFVRQQSMNPFPLINIRLFKANRVFAFSNLAALINYCATFAITFILSLFLQHVKMLTPLQAGMVLVVEPLLQALFSPLAGRLSDRYEPRVIASIGMMLTVIGLISLTWMQADTPLAQVVTSLAVLGVGFAFFSSPNVNAIMSSVENRYYGVASATLATMRMLGQMLSMGIAMLVFAVIIGDQSLSVKTGGKLISSGRLIFGILAVICIFGIFASLARGRMHERSPGIPGDDYENSGS
jgi:EmrB/QacA subfamily drug resistance transporter